jgi:hypothetical protein
LSPDFIGSSLELPQSCYYPNESRGIRGKWKENGEADRQQEASGGDRGKNNEVSIRLPRWNVTTLKLRVHIAGNEWNGRRHAGLLMLVLQRRIS